MAIPGVGDVRAVEIISNRPYKEVDDLLNVHGIGTRTLENLRPWVTIRGE